MLPFPIQMNVSVAPPFSFSRILWCKHTVGVWGPITPLLESNLMTFREQEHNVQRVLYAVIIESVVQTE